MGFAMTVRNKQRARARAGRRAVLAGACLVYAALAPAASALRLSGAVLESASARSHVPAPGQTSTGKPAAVATLEQCQAAVSETERSATFAGEMNAIAGTQRMQISIELQEQLPNTISYRVLPIPALAAWRSSAPGVQSFKYLRQVTNLSAPAFYRATIRFRWLGTKGRVIAATELHTRRCEQPQQLPATGT